MTTWFDKAALDSHFGPDWDHWLAMPYYSHHEAAALSVGIDPSACDRLRQPMPNGVHVWDAIDALELIEKRRQILYRWTEVPVSDGGFFKDPSDSGDYLDADQVARVFLRLKCEIPHELASLAGPIAAQRKGKWPWGDYETTLLKCLEAAANQFWMAYEPTDKEHDTGTPSSTVTEWLLAEYPRHLYPSMTPAMAKAIAAILNADERKVGGRPKKAKAKTG